MPQMSTFIKKLEGYADLEVSIIRTTKINKVLKALIKLTTIPRDEEFQFRKRSLDLLSQWNKILGAEPMDADAGADKEGKASPATNGVHDEKSGEAAEEKKDDASLPAEKPADISVEKPAPEAEADKAAEPTEAEVKPDVAAVEEAQPVPVENASKPEVSAPEVVEKAPESAAAASEAAEVVKATE